MIKILVVSDSHKNNEALIKLKKMYPDMDYYLHAGDSEEDIKNLHGFISVAGNCDYLIKNKMYILNLGKFNILMMHGNSMLLFSDNIINILDTYNCNVFIHGHTHKPYYYEKNGYHMMCPGSLNYPRSDMGLTYIILEINDNNISVKIKKYL